MSELGNPLETPKMLKNRVGDKNTAQSGNLLHTFFFFILGLIMST